MARLVGGATREMPMSFTSAPAEVPNMNAYTARPRSAGHGARRAATAKGAAARRGDDAPPGRLRPTTPQPGDVHALTPEQHAAAAAAFAAEWAAARRAGGARPVSYTHLTLPTIRLV